MPTIPTDQLLEHLPSVLWGLGALLALIVVLALLFRPRVPKFPYDAIPHLFTPAERSFLRVLREVIGPEHQIFGKVRVADALQVRKGLPGAAWRQAFNRIQAKHFDYLICRTADSAILLAIELDDKSHERPDRIARDRFLERATAAAKLPLLRVPCQKHYSASTLANLIREHLND